MLPKADGIASAHVFARRLEMIKEHDRVVLTCNLLEQGLEEGDVGTVVHVHRRGEGFEVEFLTLSGETVAVVTLLASQVRPVRNREITHARSLA